MNLGRHNSCPPRGRHLAKRHTLLSRDTANIKHALSLATKYDTVVYNESLESVCMAHGVSWEHEKEVKH